MRVLALDTGEKRIGVAVSDPLGIIAQGVTVIARKDPETDLNEIKRIIEEYKADSIVIGMPVNMDGTKGKSAEKVNEFVEILKGRLSIPVYTYDERLSTKESEKFLISADVSRKKRKQVIDKMAAQLILESYLERLKHNV
ncbi:MAG: Holliday junction DNA helicase RuvA [Omnitrophica WOR_2 bacterium RIFCSPHIGHO2_01_FULL_49_10]|nr:MAG: Holliday junction DNA helicase RuvA [Omnitrophica WOR_2 bacterium RIFCSPHIGHO2_01_FULL_49_10]